MQETYNIQKLHKACFQHCLAYRDFKNLTRRLTSDKTLRDKTFNIDINPKTRFTYDSCGPLQKTKKGSEYLKTGD